MKKKKYLLNIGSSIILLFYGAILLCFSLFSLKNVRVFFLIFFFLYGILKGVLYFFTNPKELMNLLSSLVGILFGVANIFYNFFDTPRHLSLMILAFALLISLIKLKKADLFHDHKNKNWLIEMAGMIFFLLWTVFVSINLSSNESTLFLVLGFYIFSIGMLEFYESFIYNITKGKIK